MTPAAGLPLDHVGIAVNSIADALPLFQALLGTTASAQERVESQQVAVAFLDTGAARLELIEPTRPDSVIARFLHRRGPGLHHIAFRVSDLSATLARFQARGVPLIDSIPRIGAHGRRVAFLHPSAAGGVLVELVEDQPPAP